MLIYGMEKYEYWVEDFQIPGHWTPLEYSYEHPAEAAYEVANLYWDAWLLKMQYTVHIRCDGEETVWLCRGLARDPDFDVDETE